MVQVHGGGPRLGRRRLAGALVALAVAASGCAGAAHPAQGPSSGHSGRFPLSLIDDEGVKVTLNAPPQRIVSFAPANTEIVFANTYDILPLRFIHGVTPTGHKN